MHSHRSFFNPPAQPHDVVVDVLERALGDRAHEGAAADALVGTALHDDDREFIERCCLTVGTRAHSGSPCSASPPCAWDTARAASAGWGTMR